MKKILLLLLIVLSLSTKSLFAFNDPVSDVAAGALTGRVVDKMGYVLPGATILIEGTHIGTVSDVNGFFRITGLKDGAYTIRVSYVGFTPEDIRLTIKDGETNALNNIVLNEGLLMNEVVVTGMNSQYKAMSQQKNSINISNVISADQVSRFPDSNIGDALKRIPGISVQYDQGEARFGHVRGTSPDLSSVTIDGTRVPSAEAEMRSVQLDLIPADMIQTIEVNKVVTANMDADAIGGSVNLITKSQPSGRRITAMGGSGYNLISEKPLLNLGFSYGNRFFEDKLGMVLAASYQYNPLGSDNIEFEWEKDDKGKSYVSDYQVRQYLVSRERQSYSAAFDYQFNPDHKIVLSGMYNKRRDWENRFRLRLKDIEPDGNGFKSKKVERQVKFGTKDERYTRLEDQRVYTFSLGGEHFFEKLQMTWDANISQASEERPNERYLTYVAKKVSFKNDLSNPKTPMASDFSSNIDDYSALKFDEFTEEYQYTKDRDVSFKTDFLFPINSYGDWKNSFSFGVVARIKSKSNDEDLYEYEPVKAYEDAFDNEVRGHLVNMTRDNYLPGKYTIGNFPDKKHFGDMQLEGNANFESEKDLESDFADFDATERIAAGYIRYDQRLYNKVDLVLGLRVEHTVSNYSANTWQTDPDKKQSIKKIDGENDSYINFLPSLIAKWDVSDDFKVKAAWTNTLARPKYIDLTPRKMLEFRDNEVSIGNPELLPTKSMNFDLMAEYYLNGGLFSAGVFYKDIRDFIVEERLRDYQYEGHTWDKFFRPINAGDADLFGIEVSMQQPMRFLPGFLRHFNIYTNYTFNYSDVKKFNYEGREDDKLSMPGSPKHTFNAALGYDHPRFSARLSYNYASDFIDELGEEAYYDRYYDAVNYLDFNLNVRAGKYLHIFANVNNILNQPLRYYQGSKEYTMQAEYYNFRFDAGVKVVF